ncbi:Rrf2 family transcriptional regulator [Formicincola oecophyllae]|uniref:Rrf2 family transcriptional regulator n=1 Tax=Formicincola oecophyllae TaxID=2558361 RepID=A0A4Y6U9B7_9PROT|nr:Rrf2 family transcriptional regulator [Formicincola oecophyllae]QDH13972.1 Rrf2 family transcriptional regulator [Formicincola oecophyllae]
MKLTVHTDYALRTLIYLGVQYEEANLAPQAGAGETAPPLVPLAEIARVYEISTNHLVKVIHSLGQGGFITTVRGRAGGVRLARAPSAINLGAVVRHTEGALAIVPCLKGPAVAGGCASATAGGMCLLAGGCALTSVLASAQEGFMAALDRQSLADIVTPYEKERIMKRAK